MLSTPLVHPPPAQAQLSPETIRYWVKVGRCEQPGQGWAGVRWDHPGPRHQGGLGFYSGTWRWWASELKPGGRSVYSRFPNAGMAPPRVQIWVAAYGYREHRGYWDCMRTVGKPPAAAARSTGSSSIVDGHPLGQWSPGRGNAINAIYQAFCSAHVRCKLGDEALTVAKCETGNTLSVWARNGQYEGLFQMGAYARGRYGHANDPWGQARAARRYWEDDGWAPWQCLPAGGLRW